MSVIFRRFLCISDGIDLLLILSFSKGTSECRSCSVWRHRFLSVDNVSSNLVPLEEHSAYSLVTHLSQSQNVSTRQTKWPFDSFNLQKLYKYFKSWITVIGMYSVCVQMHVHYSFVPQNWFPLLPLHIKNKHLLFLALLWGTQSDMERLGHFHHFLFLVTFQTVRKTHTHKLH